MTTTPVTEMTDLDEAARLYRAAAADAEQVLSRPGVREADRSAARAQKIRAAHGLFRLAWARQRATDRAADLEAAGRLYRAAAAEAEQALSSPGVKELFRSAARDQKITAADGLFEIAQMRLRAELSADAAPNGRRVRRAVPSARRRRPWRGRAR